MIYVRGLTTPTFGDLRVLHAAGRLPLRKFYIILFPLYPFKRVLLFVRVCVCTARGLGSTPTPLPQYTWDKSTRAQDLHECTQYTLENLLGPEHVCLHTQSINCR